MLKKANMQYRKLGNSGLMVSVLSYGNYNCHEVVPFDQQVKIFKFLFQNGVNFIDTAENYTDGKDEEDLGKILKKINEPRDHYIISTKIWMQPNSSINTKAGTNRKHVKDSLHDSLKRLQLQYVDIAYAHSYDQNTPIQQTCRAFHEVIQQGLAFYWGTSNWDADKVFEALQICQKYNLHKPIVVENQYNMINRKEGQEEFRTLFQKYNFGLVAYSPLKGGLLTGKYIGNKNVQGRLGSEKTGSCTKKQAQFRWCSDVDKQELDQKLLKLKDLAASQLQCDLPALAIAWVIKYPYTSCTLFGARNIEQAQDCMKALEVYKRLTKEIQGKVNKILQTHPPARLNQKQMCFTPHLRYIIQ